MTGYCSTGSFRSVTNPNTIVTMAITFAKIGRSMKNREITSGGSRAAFGGGGRFGWRLGARGLHLASRTCALKAVHDNPVTWPHPFADHAHLALDHWAHLHTPVLDGVLVVHDQQIAAALIGRDRDLGNEQRRAVAHREANA